MDDHLMALELLLEELDIGTDISTLADRKRVQKAVYLSQVAGANLGYQFSWYVLGPYSPSLTRDYFELAEKSAEYREASAPYSLHPGLRHSLEPVRAMIAHASLLKPKMTSEDWLELCASIHFQVQIVGRGLEDARKLISQHPRKSHLVPNFDEAVDILKQSRLL